ncbi:hypothetical protein EJ06DRAFT_367978 [Trichodelitschia bisporula]|uniref:Uncharacterized protein n=1 Tax=Trichodelitschia bisporula TaxID=703511 RepID=A0A6G1I1R7_9PEZI|nr:hypothetical protein EJ06DRAFT_367978 [Trichodelitschia bisporula]
MYRPNSLWTWSFLITAIVQAIIALALEGYVFGKFTVALSDEANNKRETGARTIPTYLSLLIFGFLYQLALVYDALHHKNTIQVIGLCIYNLGILVYTAIQIDQIKDAVVTLSTKGYIALEYWTIVKPFLIALPCVVALGSLIMSFIAWKLYDEFAWTIYKQISADLRLKRRYLIYQIYIALLKFDFFLFLGFEVQFLVIVVNTSDVEFYLTVASVPITILLLLLAAYSTRRESVVGMICVIIVYFGALAYFMFKLVRMYGSDAGRRADYLPARRTLTTFAVITIALLVVTIIVACWCTFNFNKGLKPHLSKRQPHNVDSDKLYIDDMPHRVNMPTSSRMEID